MKSNRWIYRTWKLIKDNFLVAYDFFWWLVLNFKMFFFISVILYINLLVYQCVLFKAFLFRVFKQIRQCRFAVSRGVRLSGEFSFAYCSQVLRWNWFFKNEAGAATPARRNYDEDNITKMNSPESRTAYFLWFTALPFSVYILCWHQ